jgi:hypothetical protein
VSRPTAFSVEEIVINTVRNTAIVIAAAAALASGLFLDPSGAEARQEGTRDSRWK